MLTSLLPGLRQLRAPFAAGAISLAAAYLFLFPYYARNGLSDRVDPAVEALISALGRPALVASGAVAAYLLGTVILSALEVIAREIDHKLLRRSMELWPYDAKGHIMLRFLTPFSRPSLVRLSQACDDDLELMSAVCRNILTGGGNRLLVSNERLHGQFDRLRSEVEFRHGLAID